MHNDKLFKSTNSFMQKKSLFFIPSASPQKSRVAKSLKIYSKLLLGNTHLPLKHWPKIAPRQIPSLIPLSSVGISVISIYIQLIRVYLVKNDNTLKIHRCNPFGKVVNGFNSPLNFTSLQSDFIAWVHDLKFRTFWSEIRTISNFKRDKNSKPTNFQTLARTPVF